MQNATTPAATSPKTVAWPRMPAAAGAARSSAFFDHWRGRHARSAARARLRGPAGAATDAGPAWPGSAGRVSSIELVFATGDLAARSPHRDFPATEDCTLTTAILPRACRTYS